MHVVVSASNANRGHAGMPEWHKVATDSLHNYLISLPSNDSLARAISKSGSFVVNFMQSAVDARHAASGHHFMHKAAKVEAPLIKGASGHLECELIHRLESGESTLFLGRVVELSDKSLLDNNHKI